MNYEINILNKNCKLSEKNITILYRKNRQYKKEKLICILEKNNKQVKIYNIDITMNGINIIEFKKNIYVKHSPKTAKIINKLQDKNFTVKYL